jgi:SnoaL-like protein
MLLRRRYWTDMIDDRDAIERLVYAYAERLDAGDLAGVAALFAGATLRSNQRAAVRRGETEVLRLLRDTVVLYDGVPCTKHVVANLVVERAADGATAASRCAITVLQARPELPLQAILVGRYHDCFTRCDGIWHFTDRLILIDLVGSLRWHVRRAASPR